ncbi:F-actin-monooxygenase mical1-like isoform X1 [Artemia franciscana]|uniref:F-actin-monooxygenase mical1-like isoform X1 n=1 Tax=Artemia franciscana TaxID=6661 RepID=UPI0032DA346F
MTISSLFNCAGKQIEPVDDASRPYQQRRAILPQRGTTDPLTAPSSLDEICPSTLPPLRRGSPNLDKQIALRSSRNLLSLSGTLRKSQSLIRSASLRISRTNVFLQSAASRLSIRSFREGRSGGKTDANSQYRLRYGSKLVPREKFRELKIFSREFNMTQDRSASSLRLTDNCNTCKLPVFLAERLKIGSKLFHRVCFKCARCAAQLTPGNQYETENGEHCCEVCPDEEGSLTSSITSLSPNISSLKISEILDSDASVDKIQEEKSKRIERFPSSVQSLISRFDTQAARSAFFTNELRSRFEEMPPNAKEEKEDEINSVSEKAFDTIKENEQSVSTNGIPESQPKLESTTDISIIHQRHSPCNPFEEEEGQPSSVSGLCSSNMEDDGVEPSVINSSAVEKEDVVSELEIDNKSDVDSLHSEDVDLSAQDMHNVDLPFVAEVGDDVQTGSADKTPIGMSHSFLYLFFTCVHIHHFLRSVYFTRNMLIPLFCNFPEVNFF